MGHPAHSRALKHVDNLYPEFASNPRSVRLGLASDGFNPFGMLNVTKKPCDQYHGLTVMSN
jgi:hypothetical protein